ncbi:MAG TPA: DUF5801 repeats-in-toxin domain-containing protein, partial [Pseudolabrys sp.]|nr:DUF5801 repeats-in-toxin domain-containing protein [Pseudolabrys sp.]
MNGPFVVAQANTGSGATPVQVIQLIKPSAGKTDIFHASFTGTVKIDFTQIANEKITLFHDSKNQSLHVIFADGSQIIIEPFFDSRGTVLANLIFEMGPNQFYGGEEFAQKFPITEDQSVLPAAGEGTNASGADFHDPSVDPLGPSTPLGLLPPEELPGINFIEPETPLLTNDIPQVVGKLRFIVEEDELRVPEGRQGEVDVPASGNGNEDTNDVAGDNHLPPPGNDQDVFGDFTRTQKEFSGNFDSIVLGGEPPHTYGANPAADGQPVLAENGVQITSLGDKVIYEVQGPNDIWAVTVPDGGDGGNFSRPVFKLHIDNDGHFTLTLTDQIDHDPAVGGTPTDDPNHNEFGSLEETIFLDISKAVIGQDGTGDIISFPTNTIDVGVIDDTPIVKPFAQECVTVDEDDINTNLSHGTSPNDGNFFDGSFTGNPGDNSPGPATVFGDLSGLVSVGADAVYIGDNGKPHGTFAFTDNPEPLADLQALGLRSKGELLTFVIDGNDLYGFVNKDGNAGYQDTGIGGDRLVMQLHLDSNGQYSFSLFDQIDHDPPYDTDPPGFETNDPFVPGDQFPLRDQNTDLIDNDDPNGVPRDFDVSKLNFGALIEFSDYDHDTVGLDGVFEIRIRDDIPKLVHGEAICLTVDEDDISTLGANPNPGSLGTSPDDGNFPDGSFTGNPAVATGGPAFVSGTMGGLVVVPGADENLTFGFTGNAVDYFLGLGLESQGRHMSFDVQGNTLIGFVDNRVDIGTTYDAGIDRLVFTFEITNTTTGAFEFKLYDQLDHDPPGDDPGDPNVDADQNFDLVDDVNGDVTTLHFGNVIQASDFDHDSVVLKDKVDIKVRDDVPVLVSSASVHAFVDEDDINNSQSQGTHPNDGSAVDGSLTAGNGAAIVSGTLTGLVQSGADEPLTFRLVQNEAAIRDYLVDLGLRSKGELLSYDIDLNAGTIIAFDQVGAGNSGNFTSYDPGAGDRAVFQLTLSSNGQWTFTLFDQMDHDPPYDTDPAGFVSQDPTAAGDTATADQNTDLIDNDDPNGDPRDFDIQSINFGHIVEAVDFDGDAVLLDHQFLISIRDDIPTVHAKIINGTDTVIVDETADTTNDDTTDPSVIALFSGVTNKGTDPHMPAPQYARDSDAVVGADITTGADEDATVEWNLVLNGADGLFSGLQTTEGKNIYLFKQGDLIVGRYEAGAGPDPAESNDAAAFAIHIDDTGHISIAQYVSIRHTDT